MKIYKWINTKMYEWFDMRIYELYGVICFFKEKETFIRVAQEYFVITHLNDPQKRQEELKRKPQIDKLDSRISESDKNHYSQAKKSFWFSFKYTVVLALIALLIGFSLGEIHPRFPFDLPKAITYLGLFLILWSSFYDRLCVRESNNDQTAFFYKIVHSTISGGLLCFGALVSFAGVIS